MGNLFLLSCEECSSRIASFNMFGLSVWLLNHLLSLNRAINNSWITIAQSCSVWFRFNMMVRLAVNVIWGCFARPCSFGLEDSLHYFSCQFLATSWIKVGHLILWKRVLMSLWRKVSARSIFLHVRLDASVFVEILKPVTWSRTFLVMRWRNRFWSCTCFCFENTNIVLKLPDCITSLVRASRCFSRLLCNLIFEISGTFRKNLISTSRFIISKLNNLVMHRLLLLSFWR